MKRSLITIVSLCVLIGCTPDPKSPKGFSLPDGDSLRGQQIFAKLNCHACHTVTGVEFPALDTPAEASISLGGEKPNVVTYGDLVSSIINPSHRFAQGYSDEAIKTEGQSKMRIYNSEMTIDDLIDLVAFLQSHYKIKAYQPTPYVPYY